MIRMKFLNSKFDLTNLNFRNRKILIVIQFLFVSVDTFYYLIFFFEIKNN